MSRWPSGKEPPVVRCAVALVLCSALVVQARAELLTFNFALSSNGVGVAYGTRAGELGLTYGMAMRGSISYDPATPGVWAPDTIFAEQMLTFASPGAMTLAVGGHTFTSAPGAPVQIEWHPGGAPSAT